MVVRYFSIWFKVNPPYEPDDTTPAFAFFTPMVTPRLGSYTGLNITFSLIMSKHLSFYLHVSCINAKARQSMYALRVLGAQGLKGTMMDDVTKATTVARMLYEAPAWWGFVGQGNEHDSKQRCV